MTRFTKTLVGVALGCATLFASTSTTNAAEQKYDATYFKYAIYVGGGSGTLFNLKGTQRLIGVQYAYSSGQPVGVMYHLEKGGTTVDKYSILEYGAGGVDTASKWDGAVGYYKVYIRNYYHIENYPAKASGTFYY